MGEKEKEEDVERGHITRRSLAMPNFPKLLSVEEKKYLLAVERSDMANVKRMLQQASRKKNFDINCLDSLGRGALTISIDQENLEMVELLIIMGVKTGDALLHAINVEFVEAVELLLEHEELIHQEGEPYSWQKVDNNTASFTPDITPLILAAHRNNYEILKILLDRGATLPMPHDIKCGCDECIKLSQQDSLRQALSRLNEYRALASPSLIALSSSDPILTAFQLSWELRSLAFAEPECKSEYLDLRRQCQQFAVDLLHQSRSSQELAIILNHDPENPTPYEEGEHMHLSRLELAIQYKQKKFVSHPNIQQLLAAIWYEGVPGFRRKTPLRKIGIIVKVALLFPFYCMLYIVAPNTKTGKLLRKPFMKFLIHASSYLFFLLILILVSQRAEDLFIEHFGSKKWKESVIEKYERQRGNAPMFLEYVVLIYVIGFIYEETYEMYVEGITKYLQNMWNIIDFTRNFLYSAVIILRLAAYIEQKSEIDRNPGTAYLRREEWASFDFQLVAEGLFAAANIFSAVKLVHLFSINPHLGPLQISLGRMVIDIVKFFFIYSLVLFAFACGLNQLLWYFSDLERQKCFHSPNGNPDFDNFSDSCMKWRRFANVFESSQSLFWASFGLVDLSSFELTGIKTYTRFWGLLMFGSYSVINVIVLLNLLIAMMSNSYAIIDEHSDTEWKFARTKLWMSYFEESATLPPPFNIIPTPKMFLKFFGLRKKDKIRKLSSRRRNREEKERDYKYSAVMRALVWRYVASMHKKEEENPVTEDDVNELKSDISSFRFEIMDVLHRNGMAVSSAERKEKAILGKKNKVWERRLMKDFKVGPVATEDEEDSLYSPPENESPTSRFRRVAKLAILNSGMNKWRQVVKGACIASQIGHCHNRDSFKKQQNLQRAMMEAKKLSAKSPDKSITPIKLPDITELNIMSVIEESGADTLKVNNDTASQKSANALREEADLINLQSQKPSPEKAPPSPSFKYILSDEFYSPKRSARSRSPGTPPTTSNVPEIRSKTDTELNGNLRGKTLSPELKITGTNGEEKEILKSPIPTRKFSSSVPPTPKKSSTRNSEESRSLLDVFPTSNNQNIEIIGSKIEDNPFPSQYALSYALKPENSLLTEEKIWSDAHKEGDHQVKEFKLEENISKQILSSQNGTFLSVHPANEVTPMSATEERAFVQLEKESHFKTKPDKVKGQSVSFSTTIEDERTAGSRSTSSLLSKKASPKPSASSTSSPNSLKKSDSPKPSTSSASSPNLLRSDMGNETILRSPESPRKLVSPTVSPSTLRLQSPMGSESGKSPLASRNIHRVQKRYQPKYGWL